MGRLLCPMCNEEMKVADMHEVFFRRSLIMKKSEEEQLYYHSVHNCVLLHPLCHQTADYRSNKVVCGASIIRWEGYEEVKKYIQEAELHFVKEELSLLEEANDLYKSMQHL